MNDKKSWRPMGLLVMAATLLSIWPAESFGQIYYVNPRLMDPETFVEITAGDYHTCARKYNGNVYCWGRNDWGQIGNGADGSGTVQNKPMFVTVASRVDAGAYHTCALNFGGFATCWGNNQFGALGANDSMAAAMGWGSDHWSVPIAVDGGITYSSISAGTYSTCGTRSDGVIFCWGAVVSTSPGWPSPKQMFTIGGFRNVSVGYLHGCANFVGFGVSEADCWGSNQSGQSGLDPNQFWLPPGTASFGTAISRVTTESNFTCADQSSGIVQCVGYNGSGQLGNGKTWGPMQGGEFAAQNVGNGMPLKGVTTGTSHACALNPNNNAFCWGNGSYGKLGNANSASFSTPQAVASGTFRAIAAGAYHTCAIGMDNKIYCWGNNSYGQLGQGWTGSWTWTPFPTADPK
jgi:alpha-tubulin suppressor-like RCC1 family protein